MLSGRAAAETTASWMSAPGNVFYKAAVAMRKALDKYERETDVAQLYGGRPDRGG